MGTGEADRKPEPEARGRTESAAAASGTASGTARPEKAKGSIGRTDFPYGDHDALIDAIKTKLLPLGDDMAFICGHGQPSTIGEERQTNPFIQ